MAAAETFSVNTGADGSLGAVPPPCGGGTECTLRQAIELSNENGNSEPDTIVFAIGGPSRSLLVEVEPLPAITSPLTIKGKLFGSTEEAPTLELVPITGAQAGSGLTVVGASGVRIEDLSIGGFATGIEVAPEEDEAPVGTEICGDYIGVEVEGVSTHPNGTGVEVRPAPPGEQPERTTIGNGGSCAGNVIGGNSEFGIVDSGLETTIAGNRIGIGPGGTLPNGSGPGSAGILETEAATDALIGDKDLAGPGGNLIDHNAGAGVLVEGSAGEVSIRHNSISENEGLGIEITAGTQPAPTISSAATNLAGELEVEGTVTGTTNGETVELEFFGNPACDPLGAGEGQTNLYTEAMTVEAGPNPYSFALPVEPPRDDTAITATSTREAGGTTEFSECAPYAPPAKTFTVDTLEDNANGGCLTTCSLREAIEAANETVTEDTIDFSVAGTIKPDGQDLPELTAPVTIDGTTAPGYGASPVVEIDGTEAANEGPTQGLRIGPGADGSTIKGLAIANFEQGVIVAANHSLIEGDTITGNEGLGIYVSSDAPATAIRRSEIYEDGVPIEFESPNSVPAPGLEAFVAFPTETAYTVPIEGGLPNETYAVDLFANKQCEGSGFGPAEVLLGSGEATTEAAGKGVVVIHGGPLAGIDAESFTATATEASTGTTSQLSICEKTPPETEILTTPPTLSSSPNATFTFSGTDFGEVAGFECSLDAATFAPCTTPQEYTDLADGSHTFAVRAIDGEGSADPTPPSYTWTIDTEPPEVTITAGPSETVNSTSATFEFTATDAGSPVTAIECSLDGSAFAACASPRTYPGLANGPHTFEVKATDEAGNTSTPVSRTWTIDTETPAVTITAGPSGATSSTSAIFEFTATETGSPVTAVECSLDGAPFANCESPQEYTGLSAGSHAFEVQATDQAGNTSAPVGRTWRIQTQAPIPAITAKPPAITEATGASFEFGAGPEASGYECSLDGGAFEPCSSPRGVSGLAPGVHTFAVRSSDEAGNRSAPMAYEWTVASPPPQQQASPPAPEGPGPTNGEKVIVKPEEGKVLIKLPGTKKFVALKELKEIPVGAVIDATNGRVTLTSIDPDGTEQTAEFFGGVFRVKQREGAGLVVLELLDTNACPATASVFHPGTFATASAARPRTAGKLWGSGHGNFRTEGNDGSATVRGTIWLVEDRCDGTTFFRTRRGVVSVRDFVAHKTLPLPAGKTYLAGE